jgi:hypothetical protein
MLSKFAKQALISVARADGLPPERISAMMAAAADGQQNRVGVEQAPALLTQAAKARQLGISRFSVRKLVAVGKLHPIELLPGLWRYRSKELVED